MTEVNQKKMSEQEWLDFLDETERERWDEGYERAAEEAEQSRGDSKNMLSKSDRRFLAVAVLFLACAMKLALVSGPKDPETLGFLVVTAVVLGLMCL